MIKSSIEKLAKEIGYDIGHSDNIVQSDLLNGLADGMSKIQNNQDYDMQICYIADMLNKNSVRMIEQLKAFNDLNKNKEAK